MATVTDVEVANASFPNVRQDLNDILEALATNFSADAEPTTTYPNQFWYETDSNLLYIRNEADDAWITLASINQTSGEWEPRTAVIQAVDSAGLALKTDEGTTRFSISDAGVVSFENYAFPSADGSANQVLATDGSGTLSFTTVASDKIEEGNSSVEVVDTGTGHIAFTTDGSEAARIDSSGNLLVGKTTTALDTDGAKLGAAGEATSFVRDDDTPVFLNRKTSNGDIVWFGKDGSKFGSILTESGRIALIGTRNGVSAGIDFEADNRALRPCNGSGENSDNTHDIGRGDVRFDDVYATNGTIQTSDRNEKQDIEDLSEAEQRVAIACKGLLRKFRWKSAVEEKGDDARIHFGIIAQDLQAAFEAEGLDAGRYAMFIYSEWWETYTDVPAVEAQDAVYETVTDEEGNETQVLVSEAVEAKEAYTRTDTYETEEEAPEGAVKKSRMGVRYSELLAFIIAAI